MKTYILLSSESRCDKTDHQIVGTGTAENLEALAMHFGVRSWTLDGNGGKSANNGNIKIVPTPVLEL